MREGSGNRGEVSTMHNQIKGCRGRLLCVAESASSAASATRRGRGRGRGLVGTHCPEFYEVLQHGGRDEQTVHQRVGQEEDEKLVVGETHTVVHPEDTQAQTGEA